VNLGVDGRKAWNRDVLGKQVTVATAGQVVVPDISLGVELYSQVSHDSNISRQETKGDFFVFLPC
jgi:hypothetical protein